MKQMIYAFLFVAALALAFAPALSAAPITLSGLTFAEQSGDFVITGGVAGAGSQADPIIIYETVTGLDVTMSIRGLPGFSNPSGSGHSTGFWIQKEVLNNTGVEWDFYDHELQQILGVPSPDGDGLSFAQGYFAGRPWTSSHFTDVNEVTDVRDFINFSNGIVYPGDTVTFKYIITDNLPVDIFYLRQRPDYNPAEPGSEEIPEPGTILLLGTGLVGLVGYGRRRQKG